MQQQQLPSDAEIGVAREADRFVPFLEPRLQEDSSHRRVEDEARQIEGAEEIVDDLPDVALDLRIVVPEGGGIVREEFACEGQRDGPLQYASTHTAHK